MDTMTLYAAFAAGVVSFLSPCVLPVLPTYIAFLSGSEDAGTGKTGQLLINTLFFMTGFTIVFLVMGATASYFGQFFYQHQEMLRKSGAVFMIIMGMQILGVFRISVLQREYRPLLRQAFQGPFGALVLGMAFTVGWTPCTGPILASILAYAGSTGTISYGLMLLAIYALGFSVPFFLLAVIFGQYVDRLRYLYRWLPLLQKISGLVLIAMGLALYFDVMQSVFSSITSWEG